MPRPTLTAALARLAELRAGRDGIAKERRRIVVRDDPDRQNRLRDLDAARVEVEAEIRAARSVVEVLRAGRAMAPADGKENPASNGLAEVPADPG
jgi:hypothetical protein